MDTQPVFIDFEKNYKCVEPTPFEEIGDLWIVDQRCRVMDRVLDEPVIQKDGMFIIRTEITLECVKQNDKYILDKYTHTIYELKCDFHFRLPFFKVWPNTWLRNHIINELTRLQFNHMHSCQQKFQKRLLSLPFGNYLSPYFEMHVEDFVKRFPKKIIIG